MSEDVQIIDMSPPADVAALPGDPAFPARVLADLSRLAAEAARDLAQLHEQGAAGHDEAAAASAAAALERAQAAATARAGAESAAGTATTQAAAAAIARTAAETARDAATAALAGKASHAEVTDAAAAAQAAAQAFAVDRAHHTGTQAISTVTGKPHGHHLYSWNSGYWWLRREVRKRMGIEGPDAVEQAIDKALGIVSKDGQLVVDPATATLRPTT